MSRWDALSDRDYTDQPWARDLQCESRGCANGPALGSVFCAECLARHEVSVQRQQQDRMKRPA